MVLLLGICWAFPARITSPIRVTVGLCEISELYLWVLVFAYDLLESQLASEERRSPACVKHKYSPEIFSELVGLSKWSQPLHNTSLSLL
jgi:hypothetical protein